MGSGYCYHWDISVEVPEVLTLTTFVHGMSQSPRSLALTIRREMLLGKVTYSTTKDKPYSCEVVRNFTNFLGYLFHFHASFQSSWQSLASEMIQGPHETSSGCCEFCYCRWNSRCSHSPTVVSDASNAEASTQSENFGVCKDWYNELQALTNSIPESIWYLSLMLQRLLTDMHRDLHPLIMSLESLEFFLGETMHSKYLSTKHHWDQHQKDPLSCYWRCVAPLIWISSGTMWHHVASKLRMQSEAIDVPYGSMLGQCSHLMAQFNLTAMLSIADKFALGKQSQSQQ